MAELKPCPFCGGKKIKIYSSYSSDLHGFAHVCEINGEVMVKVESRFFKTEEEAAEAWNRRAVNVPDKNVGDTISREAAIDAIAEHLGIPAANWKDIAKEWLKDLPSVQPETAKRIVGKSRSGMTLWYQCNVCNEPVDVQDNFCSGCGRRLTDE